MDLQAVTSLGIPLPALIGAAALAVLILCTLVFRAVSRMRLVKRHPALPARFKNAAGYRALRAAEQAETSAQYELAGDRFGALQLHVDARRNYVKAKAALKLAVSYASEGSRLEAARWYEKAGDYMAARQMYAAGGQLTEAARAAKLAGAFAEAAELYMQAGEPALAAELYKAIGDTDRAVAALEAAGDGLGAARTGAAKVFAHFKSMGQGKPSTPAIEREIAQLAARVAPTLASSSDPGELEQALQLYLNIRNYAAAGELNRKLGRLEKSVDFFLRAGERRKAAEVLDELGRPKESAKLKAEDFVTRGMKREAVAQFEIAEMWEEAAKLLEELEDFLKAAMHYRRLGQTTKAADLLVAEGRHAEAAELYSQAGNVDKTLFCYEKVGDWGAYAELLEKLERYYEAGVNYEKRGLVDKAIKALQRVDDDDPNAADAGMRLGDLFQEKGMYGLAKEKYLSIVNQERISRKNLDAFYKLATAYENNGELVTATQTFEKILSFDFHFKDVSQRIAELKGRIAARTTPSPFTPNPAATPGFTPPGVDPFAQTVAQQPTQRRRYEIVKELGRGGMGVVYKARDTVLDRIVALKVLPAMFRQNEAALRNFFREAKSAAALSHPNIVTIYDTGEEGGNMYIAMEFVDGEDLKVIVSEQGALPLGPLTLVFGQMCQALGYAHAQQIVHRDIKPSNVLWTKAKQTKITDFGLARALNPGANTLTTTGGTPYYMSPEQTLGNAVDCRTDIYSLGVMMFELATGVLPFMQGDIGYHHVHTPAPDPRVARPQLPEALGAVILRCMAKRPDDRYPDAAAIFEDLRRGAVSN